MIIPSEFIVKNIRYMLLKWRYKILFRFKKRILRRHDFVRNNKRFTVAGNSTTQGWSLWSYDEGSPTGRGDRVLQANSVCNLTRRGFLVRKVYRARNVRPWTLNGETETGTGTWTGSSRRGVDGFEFLSFRFYPPLPSGNDDRNRFVKPLCPRLHEETRSNESFWSVATASPPSTSSTLVIGESWFENGSRHVLEYNICQWCELLALKVLIAERFLK